MSGPHVSRPAKLRKQIRVATERAGLPHTFGDACGALSDVAAASDRIRCAARVFPHLCTRPRLGAPLLKGALSELERALGRALGRHISVSAMDWSEYSDELPTGPMLTADTQDIYEADWASVDPHIALLWFMCGHAREVVEGLAEARRRLPFALGDAPKGNFDRARFIRLCQDRGGEWRLVPRALRWASKETGNPLVDAWYDDNGAFDTWAREFDFSRRSLRAAREFTLELKAYNAVLDAFKAWLRGDWSARVADLLSAWRSCHA